MAPSSASSALFAVTTDLPALSASSSSVRAGSMPPITSTTTSTSSRVTRPDASVVSSVAEIGVLVRAAHSDPDQLDGRPGARGELAGLVAQQPHDLAADGAAAQQRDPDRFHSDSPAYTAPIMP